MALEIDINTVAKAYARWAPVYDFVFGAVFDAGRKASIAAAERIGGRILDVGIGTGISLLDYAPPHRIVGVDYSEPMLRKAHERVAVHKLAHVDALAVMDAQHLGFPDGSNPKPFPALLPTTAYTFGHFTLRLDSLMLLAAGLAMIVAVHLLINKTKLGLAIRAVAQDGETARTMGINFTAVVLITFAIGSGVAAFAGVMNGLYYNEINFSMGLLLGVFGFSAAVVGGLGNIYGAILGGFLFAGLQTIGAVALPFASAYKDVFALAVIIAIMAWRPTGLIAEKSSERV